MAKGNRVDSTNQSDRIPSKLWKGYQPRPLPPGMIMSPPSDSAADVPVPSSEGTTIQSDGSATSSPTGDPPTD